MVMPQAAGAGASKIDPVDEPVAPYPVIRRVGLGVLAVQLLALFAWSLLEYSRYVPQNDFAGYYQAWYLIAHGDLYPHITAWHTWHDVAYMDVHAELIMWLLAPLWWIFHSGVGLLWIQDFAIVGAEAVAFIWMTEVAAGRWPDGAKDRPHLHPELLGAVGLLLLVANPWIYWAASFDFHPDVLGGTFALLCAYDLAHHRRRFWLWAGLAMLCGDVASTYVAGVGISGLLAGAAWRRRGLLLLMLGTGATAAMAAFGANLGSTPVLSGYETNSTNGSSGVGGVSSLVSAPFVSPTHFFRNLWPNRLNIYANLAPAGGIGIFCAWGFGVPVVVLLETNLPSQKFSLVAFQNLPVYTFVAVGSVMVLARLARWRPGLSAAAVGLVAVSSLGWFSVWFPKTANNWLRVSPAAAATVRRGLAGAPNDAEIVASQGVEGALAGRHHIVELSDRVVVSAPTIYFVTAPTQGIETTPAIRGQAQTAALARLPAHLVASGGGVFVFRWQPPPGLHTLTLSSCCHVPAWVLASPAGRVVTTGDADTWHVTGGGTSGYVVAGDYWSEPFGNYEASVDLSGSVPVNVEVWDATDGRLITRQTVAPGRQRSDADIHFRYRTGSGGMGTFSGVGPFRVSRVPPASRDDQLEIRVSLPQGGQADVYTVSLRRLPD
jgi:hypothetical protein